MARILLINVNKKYMSNLWFTKCYKPRSAAILLMTWSGLLKLYWCNCMDKGDPENLEKRVMLVQWIGVEHRGIFERNKIVWGNIDLKHWVRRISRQNWGRGGGGEQQSRQRDIAALRKRYYSCLTLKRPEKAIVQTGKDNELSNKDVVRRFFGWRVSYQSAKNGESEYLTDEKLCFLCCPDDDFIGK